MTDRTRRNASLFVLTLFAGGVFFTGIQWGLPSRVADPYLFGERTPWTGREIMALAGDRPDDASRGADVALHPIADRSQPVTLNGTDRERAEIVRRYRLFTYQPDEMVTPMALARMKPNRLDFDPKLYQYGGLFVYPVGAVIKLAAIFHLVELKPDVAYYLDHPEAFGRFYVIARGTVALWGIVGAWVVFRLTRQLTGGVLLSLLAGVGYVCLPVVVNMSHEAKPHLPGAVLMLLAVVAADWYVRDGRRRSALIVGAICGAATGIVLTALLVFAIIPVMVMLRPQRWGERLRTAARAMLAGIIVYFVTNPYVAINLFRNRQLLKSNLTNTAQMFPVGGWGSGAMTAARLVAEGASPGVAMVGVTAAIVGAAWFLRSGRSQGNRRSISPLPLLLAVPALIQTVQFFAMAAGKPGEYGRFAVLLDVTLLIAAVAGLHRASRELRTTATWAALLVISVGAFGARYLVGFVRDCRPITSRLYVANELRGAVAEGATSIAVWAEPAPYSLPPVDLFKTRLILLPPGARLSAGEPVADLIIPRTDAPRFPVDVSDEVREHTTLPPRRQGIPLISWADRTFTVLNRFSVGETR